MKRKQVREDIDRLRNAVKAELSAHCDVDELEMTLVMTEPTTGIVSVRTVFATTVDGEPRRCEYKLPISYPFGVNDSVWIAAGLRDSVTR